MKVWALIDNRAGNNSQSIGLAQNLTKNFEVKQIKYNKLANLPNLLKKFGIIGISNQEKARLINNPQQPDIIISTGRKLAIIALFLKKHYPKAFLVQIMNPNYNFNKFDLVILPEHDKNYPYNNIIRSIGSLTKIDQGKILLEYQKFQQKLSQISQPKIALLIGGSSKKGKFTPIIAQNLRKNCQKIANNMKANLLILNSPRTDDFILKEFENNLEKNNQIFKYDKNLPNPYLAIIYDADFIIATGDSVSICSEICTLDKPIYIFYHPDICSKKHLNFLKSLFNKNYALKLDENTEFLENYSRKTLNETTKIAKKILSIHEKNNNN